MTKQEYNKEFQDIVIWAEEETKKINKKLPIVGLDGNKEVYKKIHEEYNNRIKELKNKYENSTY